MSEKKLVRPERIELPTSWFVAKHSIQLSYGRIVAELRLWIITEQNRFAQPGSPDTLVDKNLSRVQPRFRLMRRILVTVENRGVGETGDWFISVKVSER